MYQTIPSAFVCDQLHVLRHQEKKIIGPRPLGGGTHRVRRPPPPPPGSASDKGTQQRSGPVTHLKRKLSKTGFFLLSMCVGHNSLSCGTIIYVFLSIGNSFKTCIITVDLGKAFLNRVAKSIGDIFRYHKIIFDTISMLVTRKYWF